MEEKTSPTRNRVLRYVAILLGLIFTSGLALEAGFITFKQSIPQTRKVPINLADGIVALTGGADRIQDAMELLSKGRAKRLLISGVHPHTDFAELMHEYQGYSAFFKCCVELDYRAQNTIGNAMETFYWADEYKLRSLIVVTSDYHMPRSLLELHHVMPKITLLPYPVISGKVKSGTRLANPFKERLLFSEYMKYILAHIRLGFSTIFSTSTP